MNALLRTLAATAMVAVTAGAAAATPMGFTFGVTEGNGQNRDTVAGTTDLNFDTNGPYDLGTLDTGDVIGVYGRIVDAVDRFEFTFDVTGAFEIGFDLDGYDVCDNAACTETSFVSQSGLVAQDLLDNLRAPNGKSVIFKLFKDGAQVGGTQTRETNLTSASDQTMDKFDPLLFSESEGGVYKLVIDGRNKTPALYDILITETTPVPLPAGMALLITGLGGLVLARRRRG